MDQQTSALLVDLQNDTVGEPGAFADSGAAEFAARHGVIETVKRLVDPAVEEQRIGGDLRTVDEHVDEFRQT